MTDGDFSGEAFSTSHYLVRCVRVRVGVGLMLVLWLWSGLYVAYMSTWQKLNDGVFPTDHARAR